MFVYFQRFSFRVSDFLDFWYFVLSLVVFGVFIVDILLNVFDHFFFQDSYTLTCESQRNQ